MLISQRHRLIRRLIADRGVVQIAALSKELGVSAGTVRRDRQALSSAGVLRRVHGGAVAVTADQSRGDPHSAEKSVDRGRDRAFAQRRVMDRQVRQLILSPRPGRAVGSPGRVEPG